MKRTGIKRKSRKRTAPGYGKVGKAIKVACVERESSPCLCGMHDHWLDSEHRLRCGMCKAWIVPGSHPERMHDSILEYERSEMLLLLQREGHIEDLEFHPHIADFPGRPSGYTADARYRGIRYGDSGAHTVIIYEDVKGVSADADWKWIKNLWAGVHCDWRAPGVLREVTRGKTRKWIEKDIHPGGVDA